MIDRHFWWRVMLFSNHIDPSKSEFLSSFPSTFYDLVHLLESLESCCVCLGNTVVKKS